jgi:hypothetical protein
MINIVESYIELKKNMGALINKSGYKNAYLAEQIGMPAPTFSMKKQRGNWNELEMSKLRTKSWRIIICLNLCGSKKKRLDTRYHSLLNKW